MLLVCVYLSGLYIGRLKCQTDNAINNQAASEKFIRNLEVINVKVNNTAIDDIRRVLRQKYTIAE